MIQLCNDHKLRSEEKKSVFGAHFTFSIYNTESRNMYKDHRTLDLAAVNSDELESWKASFLRAGVYPEYVSENEPEAKEETKESADPQLERQVQSGRARNDKKFLARPVFPKKVFPVRIRKNSQKC